MQRRDSSVPTIREYLEDLEIRRWLQKRLVTLQEQLKTPIGKAAELVGVPETRLRYWETLNLLRPERAADQTAQEGTSGAGQEQPSGERAKQRYYGIEQLARALIINRLLEDDYNLIDIGPFMKNEAAFIEHLITESPLDQEHKPEPPQNIMQLVTAAEEALLWDFFLPRAMYASLCLLLEITFTSDGRIYLPFRDADTPLKPIRITKGEDLRDLGQVLLGWRESNAGFAVLPVELPPPEPSGRYQIIPLEDLLPPDTPTAIMPVGVHLALRPQFAALLKREGEPKPGSLAARQAVARLLKMIQDHASAWKAAFKARSTTLLHDSPALTNPTLGEPLLNMMAELVVTLGRMQTPEWRFCCVLLPPNLLLPLMQRSLVVKGQSKGSPYKVGTSLSPSSSNSGISLMAYQSGVVIYRPHVTPEDPALAWREREQPIGSAIAVPLEGEYGKSLGVLYVVSAQPDAFPLECQQLLRILGRWIGEYLMGARGRQLTTDNLSDLIDEPQTVEPLFRGVRNINQFRGDLTNLLNDVIQKKASFDHLSLVVVDIDNLSAFANTYGDQAATRNLVNAVGLRLQEEARRIFIAQATGVETYRAYMDRFYLLLKDVPLKKAEEGKNELEKVLSQQYLIYAPRVWPTQVLPRDYQLPLGVTVRAGVVSYSYNVLASLLSDAEGAWVTGRLERTSDDLQGALTDKDKVAWGIDHLEFRLNNVLPTRHKTPL
jgi:DNA-binding transcriptional MerR regulator/GGDEF domain-containing protein